MAYSGKFRPSHPEKYIGNIDNIVWRSTWERRVFVYCDETPAIRRWGSEEFCIPYVSPVDFRTHRYFPDVWIETQTSNGIKRSVIEIKPEYQTVPPKRRRKTRKYIQEEMTYAVNQAKWNAAEAYCQARNWKFMVLTEKHLGIK